MLAVVALLFGLGAALAPFAWLGAIAGAGVLIALAVDIAIGPAPQNIAVTRGGEEAFALRRGATLTYAIENRTPREIRVGVIDTPSALLAYDPEEVTISLVPQSRDFVTRHVLPLARGKAELDTLYVWYENRIGLLRRRMCVAAEREIRIYPDLSAVERYGSLNARNRLIEAGLRRMRLRGVGTEPESVREWVAGDPFRAINWKATARSGRMMVAEYEAERSQNVVLLLDAGRLMTPRIGEQRKFDYAIGAALSLAAIAGLSSDKVGAVAFASEILRAYAPRAGGRSISRIASEIYDVEPRFEESDYERAFGYVRAHMQKRSLVVLFTDMVDPAAQSAVLAQIRLLSRRHFVLCVFMNDAAVEESLRTDPHTAADVYASAVALELREERRVAAATLARLGVRVIDVPARDLTTALIDQYLQIKQRGLL